MEKTTGIRPQALAEQPDFPEEFRYLWDWYMDIKGREPLSFTEIKSWSDLTRLRPLAWEVEVLRLIDRIYWRAASE